MRKNTRAGDDLGECLVPVLHVPGPARKKPVLMQILRITLLLVFVSAWSVRAAGDGAGLVTLEKAREEGRVKSRFLKESQVDQGNAQEIPRANLVPFQASIGPILKKNCLACHGPRKSSGRLRVDKLNPDLLTGPDVERWREIYNVIGNSERPPADKPDYALADADRGRIVNWLGAELK